MMVKQIMQVDILFCRREDRLSRATQLMWDGDVGVLPVVDEDMRPVGMITDRDICMATYSQGLPPQALSVCGAMARVVFTCGPEYSLEQAQEIMRQNQVRRLPVVDETGRLVGLITLGDIAREAMRPRRLQRDAVTPAQAAATPAEISTPRHSKATAHAA
jgi:CBS domain-containing protein